MNVCAVPPSLTFILLPFRHHHDEAAGRDVDVGHESSGDGHELGAVRTRETFWPAPRPIVQVVGPSTLHKCFSPEPTGSALALDPLRALSVAGSESWGDSDVILATAMLAVTLAAVFMMFVAPRVGQRRVLYELKPDRPHAFGYEMSWLAIRTTDTEAVLDALGIEGETASNWNNGIGTVYDRWLGPDRIFVSPPVDGWTFVISLALPHPVRSGNLDKCVPLLTGLARQFADVQYFFSYPALDFYAWVRFRNGALLRAFASSDEGVIWSKGRATSTEQSLGLKLFEFRGMKGRSGDTGSEIVMAPTPEQVMQVARGWSRDPTKLAAGDASPALGYIAPAPRQWRMEQMRKSAA